MRVNGHLACVGIVLLASSAIFGADWFAAPDGKPTNTGTKESAWDLKSALEHPKAVQPGDTIWLRGGTYTGVFECTLKGVEGTPILMRGYPGERATIDGKLNIKGGDTWYWGFEVMSSDPRKRSKQTGSWPDDVRNSGIDIYEGRRLKLINLVIHDCASSGIGAWLKATDLEIYGCIVYYNGWIGPDRAHGHSLYTQNKDGMKIIRDNIMFKQYMYGIQAYGSGASYVDNYLFEGNVLFRNGVDGQAYGLLLGIGVKPVHNIAINTNFFYNANAVAGSFGYYYGNSPNEDLAMKGNYVVGTSRFYRWKKLDAAENTIVGPIEENTIPEAPAMVDRTRNTVLAEPPTGVAVFVRPNKYEPGRAHVIIYNWDRSDAVRVNLSEVLKADAAYEVRDAQNLYGAPVTGGTNDGKPISIPMKGLTVAKPIGKDAPAMPPHTAPEFGVFVVMEAP